MKRILIFIMAAFTALAACSISAAAYKAVGIEIWVDIVNGGTAQMTASVNCPLPDKQNITLKDGKTDSFYIKFNDTGQYSYTINVVPDGRKITFDKTVYRVNCYVTDKKGTLCVNTVIYNMTTGKKYDKSHSGGRPSVTFKNKLESPVEPSTAASERSSEDSSGKDRGGSGNRISDSDTENPPDGDGSRPQTGDDSHLELYLFLCILASAGLFILSVTYLHSINRLIKR